MIQKKITPAAAGGQIAAPAILRFDDFFNCGDTLCDEVGRCDPDPPAGEAQAELYKPVLSTSEALIDEIDRRAGLLPHDELQGAFTALVKLIFNQTRNRQMLFSVAEAVKPEWMEA